MPLKMVKPDYSEYINSKDVVDEIMYGRKYYPVVDLCAVGEYEDALALLQKGYRCLHDDFALDVEKILYAFTNNRHLSPDEQDNISAILNILWKELEQLSEFDYHSMVNSLGHLIAEEGFYARSMKIIGIIRRNMPVLYSAFINLGEWSVSDLIGFDTELVEDYLLKWKEQDNLSEFTKHNKVDEEETVRLLLKLISLEQPDEFDACLANFYAVSTRCEGIFPDNFTCDVAVIYAIGKLRMITKGLDDCCIPPDREEFTTNGEVQKLLGKLNRLLKMHMHENYTFDRVIHVMIMYCGMNGTEYDLEDWEIPQDCDYFVLEETVDFAKCHFGKRSIPISEDTLENVNVNWMDIHGAGEWANNYALAILEIGKLTEWFWQQDKKTVIFSTGNYMYTKENIICLEMPTGIQNWERMFIFHVHHR